MIDPAALDETRAAYDAVASLYAEKFSDSLRELPVERAVLAAFAEVVRERGPVADLGCGPGHVTAHLHTLGVPAFGVDLSTEMIALARAAHPHLRFDEGTMTALDVEDGALGGILAFFSTIHTRPSDMPAVFAEFHRVLAPGGHVLVAFFLGDEPTPQVFDHKVTPAYRWAPDVLVDLLRQNGFEEVAQVTRAPREGERPFGGGMVLVRRPALSP